MTTPLRKRTAAETLAALEMFDDESADELDSSEDEMDRILALSDADLDAELAEAGFDPQAERARGAQMGQQLLQAAGDEVASSGAKVVPLRPPTRRPSFLWLAAAAVAGLTILGATEHAAIVAWLRPPPEPILPDNIQAAPTPRELAEKLRDEADEACAKKLYGLCGDKLDDAQKLDPAGETDERVKRIRAVIHDGTTFVPERHK